MKEDDFLPNFSFALVTKERKEKNAEMRKPTIFSLVQNSSQFISLIERNKYVNN